MAIAQLSLQVNDDLLLDPHVVLQLPDPPQLVRVQFLAVKDLAGLSQLEQRVAQYVVLWFFSLVCLFVIVFTCQYVPETSNRDHPVVQAKFDRLGKVVRASPWVSPCPSPSATSVRKLHFKTQLFTQ